MKSEPPEFVLGETNKSADFLAKFPLGKARDNNNYCHVIINIYHLLVGIIIINYCCCYNRSLLS